MSEREIDHSIREAPILVVDDTPANAVLLSEVLRHAGFAHVDIETDSRHVYSRCCAHTYDLILLDIRMPHLDGFEVIEQLRPLFDKDYLPIVVITAQMDQETRRRSLEAGARDFLTKPIATWELLQRVRNILEIRVLYRQVHDQNQGLERRVLERTHELSEALETARLAERAKLDFLAMMSHELRTPLNAIIGFAEVLGSHAVSSLSQSEFREYVRQIEDGGKNLLGMVNTILDYSRGSTGALGLHESEIGLRVLLRYCMALLRPKANTRSVQLETGELPPLILRGDERRLREMLLSLLDNAIKFNHPGGRVHIEVKVDPATFVTLSIHDTGPGIPPDRLQRIFEPFTQGEGALQRRHEGIGMGLAIVCRFAELHGGRVEIESTQGQGTTAHLRLPASRIIA